MNWDALGAIGEVVGAVAVIATLGYLAVQIRQNTRSVRSSTYQSAVGSISDWSRAVGMDPRATHIYLTGSMFPDRLSDEERGQFLMLMVSLFRNYENMFYQHRQGALEESVWNGWANHMVRNFWSPGGQQWWPGWRMTCQGEFREFLEGSTRVAWEQPTSLWGRDSSETPTTS